MSVGGSLGVEVGLLPGVGEVSPFLIVGIEGPVLAPEIHALELGLGLAFGLGFSGSPLVALPPIRLLRDHRSHV